MARQEVCFCSKGEEIHGWLYLPEASVGGEGPYACLVMAHGLGGVRQLRLPHYAEAFVTKGYACLVFDYRFFGDSGGSPRQVLSIGCQLEDWEAALLFLKKHEAVDSKRLVLWGTSLSGGHVLFLAARHPEVAAAIVQCPFTSGVADGFKRRGWKEVLRYAQAGLSDLGRQWWGAKRHYLPIYRESEGGGLALLMSETAAQGYRELLASEHEECRWENAIAARFVLDLLFYAPIRSASRIECPLLVLVCDKDEEVNSKEGHYAAQLAQGRSIGYPIGHFDIYKDPSFSQVVHDEILFLQQYVPI